MVSKTNKPGGKTSSKNESNEKKDRSEIFKELGDSTSTLIRKAAYILEEEIASALVAARDVERSMREEKELPPDQFGEIIQRLRKDAHDLVNIISENASKLSSKEVGDLPRRFQQDAHDAIDILLNLVNTAPEIINKLNKVLREEKSNK